jgi:thiol-disulfide isomerase/thioredoxin
MFRRDRFDLFRRIPRVRRAARLARSGSHGINAARHHSATHHARAFVCHPCRACDGSELVSHAQDLTESSSLGTALSVITIAALCLLALLQAKSALAVTTVTRVEVDHSEDGQFSINLKVTLPELSCEWAALESVDAAGNRRRHDLASSAVYKSPIGGRVVALEHAAKAVQPVPVVVGASTDKDHYGGRRIATELTPAWFDTFIGQNDVAMVVFHAPWCPHCVAFAPVWEHAAELVLQRLATQHSARTASSPAPPRVSLGSVDCTVAENKELCKRAHIMAFPTIRVYRAGSQGTAFDDAAHAHHESYTGDRTAEAVADFAMTVAQEVLTKSGSVSAAQPGSYALGWQPPGTDANADGVKDSRVLSRGCTLEGTVRLARVPGEIQIVPHGVGGVSFDMSNVNMTHSIEHLSFGAFVPSRAMYAGWCVCAYRSSPAAAC